MHPTESFFDQVTRYFNDAARFTTYPEGLLSQIRCCNSIYRFDFPLRLGKQKQFGLDPIAELSWDIATQEMSALKQAGALKAEMVVI